MKNRLRLLLPLLLGPWPGLAQTVDSGSDELELDGVLPQFVGQ